MKEKINILGTIYKISFASREENKKLEEVDGYTDTYLKNIVVSKKEDFSEQWDQKRIEIYQNKVLRHEIVHAFLYESGLDINSIKFIIGLKMKKW